MLPRVNRLTSGDSFRRAIRTGRRAGAATVVLHFRPAPSQPDQPAPRLLVGFVVSRAVGGAVVRNTCRRRLRHLMQERLTALPSGGELVVRALPEAGSADSAALGADLDTCLRRLRERSAA